MINKEEILKAAQKDRYSGKEAESRAGVKATLLGSIIALIVGAVLFLLEFFIKKSWNFGLIAVAMTASCVQLLYEGIKLKTVRKIIVGSVEAIVALLFIALAVWKVVI